MRDTSEIAEDVRITRVPQGRRGRRSRPGHEPSTAVVVGSSPGAIVPARSKSVSRVRTKGRLALAFGEPEAPQLVRIDKTRRRDGGPNALDKSEWPDPDDVRPNQRTARSIRGFTRGCALRRIQKSGSSEITEEHVRTAEYVRSRADIAVWGFSAERDGMPVTQLVYGPKLDFSAGCHAQARAIDEFKRVWNTLTERQQRMLVVVVLQNYTIPVWCRYEEKRCGVRPSPPVELGYLRGMMDSLSQFLAGDVEDAVQRQRMRA